MNNVNKTILASVLCVMIICIATYVVIGESEPVSATIVGTTTDSNGLQYECYDDSTAKLINCSSYEGSIVVPATVSYDGNEYSVNSLQSFQNNTKIESITFESENIQTIVNQFAYCTSLTHVKMNVTSLAAQSFMYCTKLAEVDLGESVTEIGSDAFYGCSGLTSINLNDSITAVGYGAFNGASKLKLDVDLPNLTIIERGVFTNSGITSFKSGSVTSVTMEAFRGCANLTAVTIPGNYTDIPMRMFADCTSLETVTIGDSVRTVGMYAFDNCSKLKTIDTSSSLISMDMQSFRNCSSLTTLGFDLHLLETVGKEALLGCKSLSDSIYAGDKLAFIPVVEGTFVVKDGTTEILAGAAKDNEKITGIIMPDSVTILGDSVFQNAVNLKSVKLSENILNIGSNCFSGCDSITDYLTTYHGRALVYAPNLSEVVVPEGIVKICPYAISGTNVKKILMPDSVTTIEKYAMYNCVELTDVKLSDNLEVLGANVFAKCIKLEKISLPRNLTYLSDYLFTGCTSLKEVTIPESVNYIGQYAFNNCTSLERMVIPANVSYLGAYVFSNCSSLKSVLFNNNVTSVPDYAFNNCTNLEDVEFSYPVKAIGDSAFSSCTSIKNLGLYNVESVGRYAFRGCSALESFDFTNIIRLNAYAFQNCSSLKNVELPSSIVDVPSNAFAGCKNVKSLTLCADYIVLGSSSFSNINLEKLEIYGSLNTATSSLYRSANPEIIIHTGAPFNYFEVKYTTIITSDDDIDRGYKYIAAKRVVGDNIIEGNILISFPEGTEKVVIKSDVIGLDTGCLCDNMPTGFEIDPANTLFSISGNYLISDGAIVYTMGASSASLSIPSGVTALLPYSIDLSTVEELSLPGSLQKICDSASISGAGNLRSILVRSNVINNYAALLNSNPDVFVSVDVDNLDGFDITGKFIEKSDGLALICCNDSHADLDVITDGTQVAFNLTLFDKYKQSQIVVKLNGQELVPLPEKSGQLINGQDVSGMYYISLDGTYTVYVDGIELDHYTIQLPSSPVGYNITCSEGSARVAVDSVVVLAVSLQSGYHYLDSFGLYADGVLLVPTKVDMGVFLYAIPVLNDISISVEGVVPNDCVEVSFDSNGGTAIEKQILPKGKCAEFILPVKDGFVFVGWYQDSDYTLIYDFNSAVSQSKTLYAKWALETDKQYVVSYGVNSGAITAVAYGYKIITTGDTVYAGADITFNVQPELNHVVSYWVINGKSISTSEYNYACVVDCPLAISVDCSYSSTSSYVNRNNTYTPTPSDYHVLWSTGNEVNSGMGDWTGMFYSPAVWDHYVFTKMDNILVKMDIQTGEVIKSVDTGITFTGYYQKVVVCNGYVVDGYTGTVYTLDLDKAFRLDTRGVMPYCYENLVFFEGDNVTRCYLMIDEVMGDPENEQKPIWTSEINVAVVYKGGPTMLFRNGWFILPTIDGDSRLLATYNAYTGEMIDRVVIDAFSKAKLDAGYIDLNDGYATLTVYTAGIFDTSEGDIENIASIKIDDNGVFDHASLKVISSGTGSSYCSSLIVYGGYGFVNASGIFQVYDLNSMKLIASNATLKSYASGVHGSMTISVATDGKVQAYVLPYNPSTDVCFFEFDLESKTIKASMMSGCASIPQYASSQIHFGPEGQMIYVNDSGRMFCIGRLATVSSSFNGVGNIVITDKDGNVVEAESVKILQGATITIDGNKVIIGDYTFTASTTSETGKIVWKISEGILRGDLTVAATLAFKVTFTNGEETLQETYVELGEKPAYTGETPVKDATAQYTYTFKGWNNEIVAVTGEATYSAEFDSTVNKYTVVFKNGDTVLQSTEVEYGTVPTYTGETPVKDATVQYTYTFKGWNTELVAVTGEATYSAEFDSTVNKYTVKFVSEGAIVSETEYDYGTKTSDIAVPTVTREGYTFVSWNSAVSDVLGDATYSAVWAIDIVVPAESESVEVDLSKGESSFVITTSTDKPVDVKLPENAVVVVSDSSSLVGKIVTADMEKVENKTSAKGTAYEFTFEVDGTGYNGKMQVTLPYTKVSGEEPVIYFVNGSQLEKMNVVSYTDTTVTFETTHNSTYVVSSESVSADDNTLMVVGGILVVVIIFIIGMMFAIRRIEKTQ